MKQAHNNLEGNLHLDPHADINDPDVYVHGVPHNAFRRLRDEDPVSWWDEQDGTGFWAVARFIIFFIDFVNKNAFSVPGPLPASLYLI